MLVYIFVWFRGHVMNDQFFVSLCLVKSVTHIAACSVYINFEYIHHEW